MKCQVSGCESTELVYSGVDAIMLGGIPTEKYCYDCAYAGWAHEAERELNA